jgi:2-polyprenyl-3-methyl-5-hydroxy-6-metoxy-1,4-benzoquinol methylase
MERAALGAWVSASAYRWYRRQNIRRRDEVDVLIRWLDPRPGETILDIGCGDGMYTYEVARSDASIVGIDIDEQRLAVARRWHGSPNIQYHRMNADRLELGDEVFDKVVSFCVIEHLERGQEVLRQVHRVLKPQGLLVFSADSLSGPEITEEERHSHRHKYQVQRYYDPEYLRALLADTGFRLGAIRYLLTAPTTLHLIQWSWWLDQLSQPWHWFSYSGYLILGVLGPCVIRLAEAVSARHDCGLTLIALARKE